MYQSVDLFMEPQCILGKEAYCEMTSLEQGFLCGLIRKYNPQKVVEVGVAGGGTTSVIMKCLDMLGSDAKMYSVDVSKECYRRPGKSSGYQLEEAKDELSNFENHRFLLGKILPEVIENIGSDIDFVILDTMHVAPGELLDFLCVFPYLKKGGVIVLHDTSLNLNGCKECQDAYINKLILDSAFGSKYYNYKDKILNIGAIEICDETEKYIANVFSTFSITWRYLPLNSEIECYRRVYNKFYDEECMRIFDLFVLAQFNCVKDVFTESSCFIEAKKLSSVFLWSGKENDADALYKHFMTIDDEVVYILTEKGLIDGIVSAGDMLRYYEKKEKLFKVNKNFRYISSIDYSEAMKILNQFKTIHEVPVINNGKFLGVIISGKKKHPREWYEFRRRLEDERKKDL